MSVKVPFMIASPGVLQGLHVMHMRVENEGYVTVEDVYGV